MTQKFYTNEGKTKREKIADLKNKIYIKNEKIKKYDGILKQKLINEKNELEELLIKIENEYYFMKKNNIPDV